MKRTLLVALCATLLLTSCSSGGLSKPNENAFVGGSGAAKLINVSNRKIAPTVSGALLNGQSLTLSAGKVTVINVWASWCSPCRAEAPILEDFSKKNPEIQFAGILTRDNQSAAQSFVKRFKLTYPNFIDDAIIASFRGSILPNAIPTTLIIDKEGRVAARISGATTVALLKDLLEKVSGGSVNA